MSKLKPCPFCARKECGYVCDSIMVGHNEYVEEHYIFCSFCKAQGPQASSHDAAVSMWNNDRLEPKHEEETNAKP
jgi:hypothetical protein